MRAKSKRKSKLKRGRPIEFKGRPVRSYLPETSIKKAKRIGRGNVSLGIRIALDEFREKKRK